MLLTNPHLVRCAYPAPLQQLLNVDTAQESRRWLSGWRSQFSSPSPVWALPGLARQMGVAHIDLKDESSRSPLGSFKVLGAPVALLRLILRHWPDAGFLPTDLLAGRHAAQLKDWVVISATDGNHGRALAAAAQSVGCRCVIVLHAQVSPEREAPIAALGAEIVRIAGNYDASVHEAARLAAVNGWQVVSDTSYPGYDNYDASVHEAAWLAAANGWQVVSDTSYPGYEDVPRDVMQGYAIIADELWPAGQAHGQTPAPDYSHVILQGGVGGFAAGVLSYLWERLGAQRPVTVVLEPQQADCLYQSALQGQAAATAGTVDSVMAGLACGEASPLAWRFLQPGIDFFMTVSDHAAVQAMGLLARGDAGDVPVLSGESGAAGLAGLQALAASTAWRDQVGLKASS
ncbi:MAG: pyridoxal-phosphate dependent enzyme, partial [Burkholderiales bacterium]|nr:pyridoxal-phosphate dependent enzyme [Burkholderiales bacterium]